MSPRVIIVHGWDGYPEEGWFPWLKRELEKRRFEVQVPQLPHPETPTIEDWVLKLSETAGAPDENTYFVGHSIGCQTIIRYLETLPGDVRIGGAVFVGGRIEPGKNLIENLKREMKEETGLELAGEPKLIAAQDIMRNNNHHVVRLTYIGEANGEVVLDTSENDAYKWYSSEELAKMDDVDMYFKELLSSASFVL